jgi:hypothetical protein
MKSMVEMKQVARILQNNAQDKFAKKCITENFVALV